MEIFILDLKMAQFKLFSSETMMVTYIFVETMESKAKKNNYINNFIKNAEQTKVKKMK